MLADAGPDARAASLPGDPGRSVTPLRIALFTCGQLGFEAAAKLRALPEVESVRVFYAPYRRVQLAGLDRVRHVLRYNGTAAILANLAGRLTGSQKRSAGPDLPLEDDDLLCFTEFHEADCCAAVREFAPDLGVIVGTYILKPAIFSIPRLGSINLHTGRAPRYRGAAPAFWEMYNGDDRVGITIHQVAERVDAGPILRQETFPIDIAPAGNPLGYITQYRRTVLEPHGLRLLTEAVSAIADGSVIEKPQEESNARTYRMPDKRQIAALKRRVARRRRSLRARRIKAALGWLAYRSGLYRLILRDRALIVLFHRVDDAYAGNPISCTTGEFDAYCRFFARYFQVVSLSDLIGGIDQANNLSTRLVITFDDGYLDNVEAARTMQRHGLTACFYIATGYIGTDRDGWWDVEQGLTSRWMRWDDVRQLAEWGFEVGGHTENHVDLGKISGQAAADEILGSKVALERELGQQIAHFSYPYGGKDNITPDNRRLISDLGFESCTSAYGGAVTDQSDVLDLQRVAVSPWHLSPWQLGFELLFERFRRP